MKQEEMNTQLYEKLAAEQTKYRDWLMGQPPEEILNHAYEYAVREDILAAAELMDIPQAQAAALLAVPTEAALLRPDPSPWLDRRCWSYISDGWSLAMYLARRIGWDGEAFWERFQLARRDLLTDGVGPQPDPVLAGTAASGLCCAQIPGGREERRFWPGWGCWGALTSRFLTRRSPTPLRNVWKGGVPAGGYHLTRCCLWGTRDTATCTPACGPERAPCGFLHTQRMMRAFGMPASARRRS